MLRGVRRSGAPPVRPQRPSRRLATKAAERRPSVLIVGAGPSGLSLALTLLRNGIKPDVIEQSSIDREALLGNISEAIYLPVNTMRGLHKLGVGSQIEQAGAVLHESRFLSDKGGVIGRVNLSSLAKSYEAPAVGINYRALVKELSAEFLRSGGRIAYLSSFTKLKQGEGQVGVTFSGTRPTASYDVVVGADGTVSKVREALFDKKEFRVTKRFEKWAYYTTVVPRPVVFAGDQLSEYWGNGSRLTLLPVNADSMGVRVTFNSVYPPYAMKGGPRPVDDLLEIAEPRFTGSGLEQLWRLLPAEKRGCELIYPYEQRMQSWVNGRVVLIGDAAHTVMPNYPQLSCLAIEDGYTLGKFLLEKPSIDQALADFQTVRFPRAFAAQSKAWAVNAPGQRSNWFRRLVRAGTMFITHGGQALSRRERKLMGDRQIFS